MRRDQGSGIGGRGAACGFARGVRRGVTLVELLVVISIVLLLAAFAVPQMQPAMESRRTREAARAVNVYFGSARGRALETGRPCGVMIRRMPGAADAAMTLDQVEVPAPYAGDVLGARIQLTRSSGNTWNVAFTPSGAGDMWLGHPTLVQTGDMLQLNYQGHYYVMTFGAAKNQVLLVNAVDLQSGVLLPERVLAQGVPFQVIRQPIRSGASPLQLPMGAAIDLAFSGVDTAPQLFASSNAGEGPVCITFSPNGSLDRLYMGNVNVPITQPVFLLVGRRERIPFAVGETANWQDLTNLWVALNPQSGTVHTARIVPGNDVATSRTLAAEGIDARGR